MAFYMNQGVFGIWVSVIVTSSRNGRLVYMVVSGIRHHVGP